MPEGHVIHRLATQLAAAFGGEPVSVQSPQGRFATEAQRLEGTVLVGADAIGKHLFLEFDVPEPRWIHIHLGLIGKLRIGPKSPGQGEIRLRLSNGVTSAQLHGPQWCRAVTSLDREGVLAASGPDPLRPDADPSVGFERLHRSKKPLAALLMDQRIAAGVGNIFRAEVLFRHRLRPTLLGCEVDRHTWQAVWEDLVDLMHRAVEVGRIDTVTDEHSPEAQHRPPRVDRHGGEVYVYRRAGQPCLVCARAVRTTVLEGRNLYWCSGCQNRKRA